MTNERKLRVVAPLQQYFSIYNKELRFELERSGVIGKELDDWVPSNARIRVDVANDGAIVTLWTNEQIPAYGKEPSFQIHNGTIKRVLHDLTLGTVGYSVDVIDGIRLILDRTQIYQANFHKDYRWQVYQMAAFHSLFLLGYNDMSLFTSQRAIESARAEAEIYNTSRLSTSLTELKEFEDEPEDVIDKLSSIIDGFERVIESETREEDLQAYLKEQPFLLNPHAVNVRAKHRFGTELITDFVIELPGADYLLVELERSVHPLYTRDGNPRAELTHAERQVNDWFAFVDDFPEYVRSTLQGIQKPKGLIIIGRDSSMTPDDQKRLRRKNVESNLVEIITYDQLIVRARQHLGNLRRLSAIREGRA